MQQQGAASAAAATAAGDRKLDKATPRPDVMTGGGDDDVDTRGDTNESLVSNQLPQASDADADADADVWQTPAQLLNRCAMVYTPLHEILTNSFRAVYPRVSAIVRRAPST